MLKNYFSSCIIAVSVLCMFNCTNKEINLITNIDFEVVTDHEESGFVKNSLETVITLVPESTNYPGFSYFISYKVDEGEGYYVASDDTRLPQETDVLLHLKDDFTANWKYVGTSPGTHKITITSKDNYEKRKATKLVYEIVPVTIFWEATSPQTMAAVNDTIPMTLQLQNNSEGAILTFENTIRITEGAGLVLDADKNPITLNRTLPIEEGTIRLFYVGAAVGENVVQFDLDVSNDSEKRAELTFDIKEELINEAPTAVEDVAETAATMPVEIDALANDLDPEGDTLTITDVSMPANGIAVIENGKIVYTPNDTFVGNEPFTYTIMDAAGNEVSGTIKVTVKVRETIAIPDAKFEQALIDLGHDDVIDQKIFKDVAEGIITLNVSNKEIVDLTGIEGFTALITLTANENSIATIDVTKNVSLQTLSLEKNQITTTIDVSKNNLLRRLDLDFNELTSLDVTQNTALTFLSLALSNLSSIDLTNNVNLTFLDLKRNLNLAELDVTKNTLLRQLGAGENNLSSLDLSNNSDLRDLIIGSTNITEADFSKMLDLRTLIAAGAPLEQIDVSKNTSLTLLRIQKTQISALDVSNLNLLTELNATENSNLSCIQVNDRIAANAMTDWQKDAAAYYSEDCSQPREIIAIPDAKFEQALIDLGHDDVIDQKILKDVAEGITTLDVSNKEITDLTGIEGFANLTELLATDNSLTTVDISQNTKLKRLTFKKNQLTALDVSQNLELEWLELWFNEISAIDVSLNIALKFLDIDTNNLETIDLTSNVNLTELFLFNNKLTNIDLSKNIGLEWLQIGNRTGLPNDNAISTINLKGLTKLGNNQLNNMPSLGCIEVDDVSSDLISSWSKDTTAYYSEDCSQPRETISIPDANFEQALIDLGYDDVIDQKILKDVAEGITTLDVSNKEIADLTGIEGFINLTELTAINNNLITVDITKNTKLQRLTFKENQLTALDLSQNIALEWLELWFNEIAAIDVSKNIALKFLDIDTNALLAIDLSSNVNLTELYLFNNRLTEIDLSILTQLEKLEIGNRTGLPNDNTITTLNFKGLSNLTTNNMRNMSSLACIEVDDINASNINSWQKDTSAYYSEDCSQPRETISITDVNFEQALIDLGYDDVIDQKIFRDVVEGIKSLNLNNKEITTLSGIEGFAAIETLRADDNSITAIDLSQNTALNTLWIKDNQLTAIDLSSNTQLQTLTLTGNPIPNIDLSANVALKGLGLARMPLTSVDLSTNTALTELWVAATQITAIDVTNLTLLQQLNLYQNQLTAVDLSNNTNLNSVRLENNQLETLDVKGLSNLTNLNLINNANLECIQVDDLQAANAQANWQKDATASYNTSCP